MVARALSRCARRWRRDGRRRRVRLGRDRARPDRRCHRPSGPAAAATTGRCGLGHAGIGHQPLEAAAPLGTGPGTSEVLVDDHNLIYGPAPGPPPAGATHIGGQWTWCSPSPDATFSAAPDRAHGRPAHGTGASPEPVALQPADQAQSTGQSTGGVEGEVGRLRCNHLVPVPRVASLGELNELMPAATRPMAGPASDSAAPPSARTSPLRSSSSVGCPVTATTSPPRCARSSTPRLASWCASRCTRCRPAWLAAGSRCVCGPGPSRSSRMAKRG